MKMKRNMDGEYVEDVEIAPPSPIPISNGVLV
jgi:hypothetical protein